MGLGRMPGPPVLETEGWRKVLPILSAEVLHKLPMLVVVQHCQRDITEGCGPRQYGAGRAAGAQQEAAEVRATTRANPERCIIALDVKPRTAQSHGTKPSTPLWPAPRA